MDQMWGPLSGSFVTGTLMSIAANESPYLSAALAVAALLAAVALLRGRGDELPP